MKFLAICAPYLLAIVRILTGLLFLSHGLVKLFGFPAGAQPGIVPLFTLFGIGGVIELVTGAMVALGFGTRIAAFVAAGEMAAAYWMFHAPKSIYPAVNGGDLAILYCFIFLYFAAAGPGILGLQSNRGLIQPRP